MHNQTFNLFNDGVKLSLDADQLRFAGQPDQAAALDARALQCFNAVFELEPSNPVFVSAKAFAMTKLGQVGEAVEFFEMAIELDPTQVENYYQLGLCCFELGLPEDGVLIFHEAFSISKDASLRKRACQEITRLGQTIVGFGIYCHQLQQPVESRKFFENAIASFNFALECDPNAKASREALEQVQTLMATLG